MVNMGMSKDDMVDCQRVESKLPVHSISFKTFPLEHAAVEKYPFVLICCKENLAACHLPGSSTEFKLHNKFLMLKNTNRDKDSDKNPRSVKKQRKCQCQCQSAHCNDGLHYRPRLKCLLFIHPEVFAHYPESAVVHMRHNCGSGGYCNNN